MPCEGSIGTLLSVLQIMRIAWHVHDADQCLKPWQLALTKLCDIIILHPLIRKEFVTLQVRCEVYSDAVERIAFGKAAWKKVVLCLRLIAELAIMSDSWSQQEVAKGISSSAARDTRARCMADVPFWRPL